MARAVCILLILSYHLEAFSQEAQPGDPCTGAQTGQYRLSGGPELTNTGHLLVCDGSNWNKVISFSSSGVVSPSFIGPCSDGDLISYDSATGGMSCSAPCNDNTPNGFSFTDNASAAQSTLTTSNILQISGINCQVTVNISGEGSPQFRICSDSSCTGIVQDWTNTASFLQNNQYLQLRLTSSAAGGDTYTANVTVGGAVDDWNVTPTGDCTGASPAIGTVCADGTVYIGLSPDGNVKMYTTRCNYPRTWSGASCTGPSSTYTWNNGTAPTINLGASSNVDGDGNTTTIQAASNSETPYNAANVCDTLNENGHTDWYLPSCEEVEYLVLNQSVLNDISSVGTTGLWTSTETAGDRANKMRDSDGSCFRTDLKSDSNYVRCVRK